MAGSTQPRLVLSPKIIASAINKTYATEVALLAAAPANGTLAYATDTGVYFFREAGVWVNRHGTTINLLTPPATTQTINLGIGTVYIIDLETATGSVTLTLTNPRKGVDYWLKVIQGSTTRNLIWPATVLWPGGTPPIISVADDAIDRIALAYDGVSFLGRFDQAFA